MEQQKGRYDQFYGISKFLSGDAYGLISIWSKGREYLGYFDPEDMELVKSFKWNISNGYAVTSIKGRQVKMHRLILGLTDPNIITDHRNHKKLDNRRENIRACTYAENARNRKKHSGTISKYKGVYWDGSLFQAQITVDGRRINIGHYRSEITAAKAYDQAARKYFKEFALVNFPDFYLETQLSIQGLDAG